MESLETNKALNNSKPLRWVPSTWFAMGLPFVALATAASIMYKSMGISDEKNAYWTSLIMLPWTLKPLWGPFLEMYKTKKFFVVLTQMLTGVMFGLLALTLHLPNFFAVSITVLAIIAFSGATHDIAADGIYINALPAKDQARFVGWQGAFYNIAKIVSGGLLVYIAGILEKKMAIASAWAIIMLCYAGIMIVLAFYNSRVLPTGGAAKTEGTVQDTWNTLVDVIKTFFQKKNIWWGLAFIVFYRFAEGHAIKIAPLFFKAARAEGGLGLSTDQIGILYGTVGAISFVLGSIASGYFVANKGLTRKTLLILCAIFNLPFAAYSFLAITLPTNMFVIGAAIAFEYFGYGFGFVGLILFIMQNIAPGKYKMAHYAFASGLMNLGFMIPSMLSGAISQRLGYKEFFLYVLLTTIPAFVVSWFVPLRKQEEIEAEEAAAAETMLNT